ncbi:MAG: queuosine precursor transporter [Candidatus Gracilibacteria bacterium]|nr:queuosine precursor transporter [Candidatus Gracilibacteria bacterium]
MTTERKRHILLGLFVVALVLANLIGAKITEFPTPNWLAAPLNVIFFPIIWFFNLILAWTGNDVLSYHFFNQVRVSVGILTVPVMFLITDIVEEVWGRKVTKEFINVGILGMLFLILITFISVKLPAAERFAEMDAAYRSIFTTSIRMAIASILAFYIAQMHDIWAFHFWKDKTKGKFLWLRNNLSTIASQLLDSSIFMFVAFYHPTNFPATLVVKLIIPYYIFKILFALLDTPFCYLGVWWVREDNAKTKNAKIQMNLK